MSVIRGPAVENNLVSILSLCNLSFQLLLRMQKGQSAHILKYTKFIDVLYHSADAITIISIY